MIYVNCMGQAINNREYALLKSFPNVILAPHTAFYTEKAVYSMTYNAMKCVHDMLHQQDNPLVLAYPKNL